MTPGKLRMLLLLRWLRRRGTFLSVILLLTAGTSYSYFFLTDRYPGIAAVLLLLFIVGVHVLRRDMGPILLVAGEYLLLALPPAAALCFHGHYLFAGGILLLAPLTALFRTGHRNTAYRMRTAWLGYSPEWTAGLRRHPLAVLSLVAGAFCCAFPPYFGFPTLALSVLCCMPLYRRNEPLQLLLLPEYGGARLLRCKVATAWRNYFSMAFFPALLTALLHPDTAWIALVWIPFAALLLLYIVLTKYAYYDPSFPDTPMPVAARLGIVGFFFPVFLPVTLYLIVRYALRAESNLDRYLHDYD